jgi:hypothetical protein
MNFATTMKYKTKSIIEPTNPEKSKTCDFHISKNVKITSQEMRKSHAIYNDFKENEFRYMEDQSQGQRQTKEKTDMTPTVDNDLTTSVRMMGEQINRIAEHIEKTYIEPKQDIGENTMKSKEVFSTIRADQSKRLSENTSETSQNQYNTLESIIQGQIDYQNLLTSVKRGDKSLIDNLVGVMVDVLLTENPTVKIGKEIKPHGAVKSVYMKLNSDHIEHVVNQYKDQRHKITYKTAYLRTSLYNAFLELDAHYTNAVRADGLVW